jgi:predicted O-methyltransferase YrrM
MLKLLEIGVLRGAGIRAWAEYLPQSSITGFDTFERVPKNKVNLGNAKRVTLIDGDSRDLNYLYGFYDFIFDDGAHDPISQAKTFSRMIEKLKPTGVYFIEDVNPKKEGYENLLLSLFGYDVKHHDLRKTNTCDSYILEVRKC